MKKKLKKGLLISIEGIDGSGKSILCKNLGKKLAEQYDLITTKEPGGSALGKQLRDILQYKSRCALSEYLLYAADRAQHFNELIIPSLKAKKLILSDRMADSSIAYQGYGRNIDINLIKLVNNAAMQKIEPDLILYLNADIETSRKRILSRKKKLTLIEQEEIDFMKKVKNAFEEIFKHKENVVIIDAAPIPKIVTQKAFIAIEKWIEKNHLI